MTAPNGYIIWSGASLIDGAPIVAIATGCNPRGSANRKTGAMIQTWILRADVSPVDAIKTGADVSICGDCLERGELGKRRSCYVNVGQAPLAVWRAYRRGSYSIAPDVAAIGSGRAVRIGSYGDPCAVPVTVWRALVSGASLSTGYTHGWRYSPELAALCMASSSSLQDAESARAQGFRVFRIRRADEPLMPRESVCPASAESKASGITCADCGACNGNATSRRGSIAIIAHGSGASHFARRAS
jgi:hypothetical protein